MNCDYGLGIHNKLKRHNVEFWYRTFVEVFTIPYIRHDLVPRAVESIKVRMNGIIRTARNQKMITRDLFSEALMFLSDLFDDYL